MALVALTLDFGRPDGSSFDITGGLEVVDGVGFVTVDRYPPELTCEQARVALRCAVKDGRIKVSAEHSVAMDLDGSSPRVA